MKSGSGCFTLDGLHGPAECGLIDVESPGHSTPRLALVSQSERTLNVHGNPGPAQCLATFLSSLETGYDSLTNEVFFELGQGADDREHHSAHRGRRVDSFLKGDKLDSPCLKTIQSVEQIASRTGEPIKASSWRSCFCSPVETRAYRAARIGFLLLMIGSLRGPRCCPSVALLGVKQRNGTE